MAKSLTTMLKLTTLLLMIIFLLLSLHIESAASFEDDDESEVDEYVLDSAFSTDNVNSVRRSRFLASTVKKDSKCDSKKKSNKCNGVRADKGASLLYCCKKHCRNVLGDRNNCGGCGNKCRLNERCCGGVCTDVLKNKGHCGKCNKTCGKGVKCGNGFCGYA